jgi:hypothetical protein
MLGRTLVQPLEEDWRDALDEVARERGWPTSHEVGRLAARVAALSAAYNDAARARAGIGEAGAARLGFSFARDVPKGAAAVRELVATGALRLDSSASAQPTLRVLDLGAGLGATTWGVARALAASGASGVLDATWVDDDAGALELAADVVQARGGCALRKHGSASTGGGPAAPAMGGSAQARGGAGGVEVRVTARARAIDRLREMPRFDLVLAGQVLSELDVGRGADERVERHARLLLDWLERHTAESGSLVVIEPALRDRTRHLHRVRDAVAAAGATVFAPCLHSDACPALARETDWCHEDFPLDLPAWLTPVARAAGLRREGLSFSYLVLRNDGRHLLDTFGPVSERVTRLRVVSNVMPSKGKSEAFLCGEAVAANDRRVSARVRATRLDRDRREANEAWDRILRGDVVAVSPPIEAGSRTLEESGPKRERPSRTLEESGPKRERPSRTLDARLRAESTVLLLGDTNRVDGSIDEE